jgi:putative protease
MDKEVGKVIHYFDKAMVVVVRLTDDLSVGDTVKFVHGENEFTQTIDSMEINHEKVDSVKAGEEAAIKVNEKTREGAKVYKIE